MEFIRPRTTGVRLFALLAVAALLSSVSVIGAARADAAPGDPTKFIVEKVDAVTGTPLPGAHFTFYDHTGTVIGSCLTDASGLCSIDGTTDFSYKVQEDTPPPGYMGQPGIISAPVIDNPQVNPPLVFRDQKTGTSLQKVFLKKVDASTQDPLQNAVFRLNGFVGETGICITDSQGMCEIDDVPAGTYEWVERAAPPGYDLVTQTSPLTVEVGKTPVVVTVEDQKTGSTPSSTLTVQKIDADANLALAGAHFTLNGANASCITDAAGSCSISGLAPGTYSWHETSAPAGYQTAADSPNIQITAANAGTTFAPTLIGDAEVRTDLTVQKVDAADQSHTLAGAKFDLTIAGNVVASCTTTAQNGSCTVPGLPFGTYTWVEVTAPPGYDLPAKPSSPPINVTAANAGTTLPATILSDTASRSTLTLKKVDAADHATPVAGATYQLYRESNGVSGLQATGVPPSARDSKSGQCTTAADGTCSIAGRPDGTYYWLEVSAPPGYALSAQPSDAVVVATSSVKTTTVSDAKLVMTSTSSQTGHQGGGLAFTGINAFAVVRAATVMLAAGVLVLLLARRRRRTI